MDEERKSLNSVLGESNKSLGLTGIYNQIRELLGPSEEEKSLGGNAVAQHIQSPEIEMKTIVTKSNQIAAAPQ